MNIPNTYPIHMPTTYNPMYTVQRYGACGQEFTIRAEFAFVMQLRA